MSILVTNNKQMILDYLTALSGQPKTEELMDRYISDPNLKEHIRQAEAGFPGYELVAHQIIAEDDLVAVRATVHGVHKGVFAGMAPTGKKVSADLMLFYRIHNDRIAEFWMQLDMKGLIDQLTA